MSRPSSKSAAAAATSRTQPLANGMYPEGSHEDAMFGAACFGDLKAVKKQHITHGIPVDLLFAGAPLMIHACFRNHLHIMKFLHERGADVNQRGIQGANVISVACVQNRLHIAKWLCEKGANLNVSNDLGRTALHLAAREGHLEMVKWLCEHGANADAITRDGNNETPVDTARVKGRQQVVDYLLKRQSGAKADGGGLGGGDDEGKPKPKGDAEKGDGGDDGEEGKAAAGGGAAGGGGDGGDAGPLRPGLRVRIHGLTSKQGRKLNGKIARVMTKQSEAQSAQGRVCVKVVGSAAGKPISVHRSNLRTGDEASCAVCNKSDCELKACGICREMGLPRIYYCSRECQEEDWKKHKKVHKMAKSALTVPVSEEMRKRAEITLAVKPDHASVLWAAAESGDLEMCAALIDCGVDPDGLAQVSGRTSDGEVIAVTLTPLIAACQRGSEHVALLLVNEGCDVNFISTGTGQTALMSACGCGNVHVAKLLLDKGADIEQVSNIGGTALLLACEANHYDVVELLISRAADMDRCTPIGVDAGGSPLHVACGSCGAETADLAIATLLVSHGAKLNEGGSLYGHTPLGTACGYGLTAIVEMLLKNGADANMAAAAPGLRAGHTPLLATRMCVVDRKKCDEITKLLLANGATPLSADEKQELKAGGGRPVPE